MCVCVRVRVCVCECECVCLIASICIHPVFHSADGHLTLKWERPLHTRAHAHMHTPTRTHTRTYAHTLSEHLSSSQSLKISLYISTSPTLTECSATKIFQRFKKCLSFFLPPLTSRPSFLFICNTCISFDGPSLPRMKFIQIHLCIIAPPGPPLFRFPHPICRQKQMPSI